VLPRIYRVECHNNITILHLSWDCEFKGFVVVVHERQEMGGLLCPHCGNRLQMEVVTIKELLKVFSKEVVTWRIKRQPQQ
jgi:transcription elongation factor Elf1